MNLNDGELETSVNVDQFEAWLMRGDCLERMKEIPNGSVDMILTACYY